MNEPTDEPEPNQAEKAIVEYEMRLDQCEEVDREIFMAGHPEVAGELRAYFADCDALHRMLGSRQPPRAPATQAIATGSLGVIKYFGDYELLRELGRGGMGVVYLARQVSLRRNVAVKMILARYLDSPAVVERFRREAESAANLKHPRIVAIHEVGEHQGQHYFSMDYIEGRSLADMVHENPLPSRKAATYIRKVAQAVHFAHEQGTIHRDLKPANILVDARDEPHVTDFGLAKRIDSDSCLTHDADVLGSPSYMAPEQAEAHRSEVGPRSDVYALGATLYDLLTGRPPFRAETPQATLDLVRHSEPVPPRMLSSTIDRDLETICLKCLDKEPGGRYTTAEALAQDLKFYLNGEPIHARPVRRLERFWRWCRREPVVASLIVAVAVSLLVGTLISMLFAWRWRDQVRETDAALLQSNQHLRKAVDARLTSERAGRAATALRLASQSQQVHFDHPHLSILLAAEAVQTTRRREESCVPSAEQALRDSLNLVGGKLLVEYSGATRAIAVSPDTRWLALASADNIVRVWDLTQTEAPCVPTELRGHEAPVLCLAFSSDSCCLATGSSDQTARVWDLRASAPSDETIVLRGYSGSIGCLAMSSDRRWLVAGDGVDGILVDEPSNAARVKVACLWDLTAKDPSASARLLSGHEAPISCVAFGQESPWLATGSHDGTARLWDLTDDDPSATSIVLPGHQGAISCVTISANGRYLVTGSADQTARVWQLTQEERQFGCLLLPNHEETIPCLAITPDSRWLVTGCLGDTARLWDLDLAATDPVGFQSYPIALRNNSDFTTCIGVSPDSKWVAIGSLRFRGNGGGATRLWDLETRDPGAAPIGLRGDEGTVWSTVFSPDSRHLVAISTDQKAKMWLRARRWDLTTRSPIMPLAFSADEQEPTCLSVSSDMRWLVTGSDDGVVRVWDRHVDDDEIDPIRLRGHEGPIWSLAISPNSRWLVSGSRDNTARLWDLSAENLDAQPTIFRGHTAPVSCVAISPDNRWVATGSGDCTVRLWDLNAKNPMDAAIVLRGHERAISHMAISRDGHWLVTGDIDKTARVWDLSNMDESTQPIVLRGHESNITCLEISPDSRYLITGSRDCTVRVWDLTAQAPSIHPNILRGHEADIACLAISPDGRLLATGSIDKTVRLWNLTTKNGSVSPIVLHGTGGSFLSLAISPDGRHLAATSNEKRVWLWDLHGSNATDTPVLLPGLNAASHCMAISSDSRWLVAADVDGSPRMWKLPLDELLDLARQTARRDFTGEERAKYLLEPAPKEPEMAGAGQFQHE